MEAEPAILGFDVRVHLTQDIEVPRTIDPNVWAQVEDVAYTHIRQSIAKANSQSLEQTYSDLNLSLISCIPRAWLSVVDLPASMTLVAFARPSVRPKSLLKHSAYCDITRSELLSAGWGSVGFDVADETLSTSLLYTVGGHGSMGFYEAKDHLNPYLLFKDSDLANTFAMTEAGIAPEHGPFLPVEVLVQRGDHGHSEGLAE